jgi:hypothetical protein
MDRFYAFSLVETRKRAVKNVSSVKKKHNEQDARHFKRFFSGRNM